MSVSCVSCHRHAPGAYCYKDGATRASRLHLCVAQMFLEAFGSAVETCRDSNALSCVSHLTVLSKKILMHKEKTDGTSATILSGSRPSVWPILKL